MDADEVWPNISSFHVGPWNSVHKVGVMAGPTAALSTNAQFGSPTGIASIGSIIGYPGGYQWGLLPNSQTDLIYLCERIIPLGSLFYFPYLPQSQPNPAYRIPMAVLEPTSKSKFNALTTTPTRRWDYCLD